MIFERLKYSARVFWLACWVASFALAVPAANRQTQTLHGHLPAPMAMLQPVGQLATSTNLDLVLGLPLRNRDILTNLLQQIYDPANTNYHRYLTPIQFTTMFGPTEKDYQALLTFAVTARPRANGEPLKMDARNPRDSGGRRAPSFMIQDI